MATVTALGPNRVAIPVAVGFGQFQVAIPLLSRGFAHLELGDNTFHTTGRLWDLKRSENLPRCWEAFAELSYRGVLLVCKAFFWGGSPMAYHTMEGRGEGGGGRVGASAGSLGSCLFMCIPQALTMNVCLKSMTLLPCYEYIYIYIYTYIYTEIDI